MGFQTLRSSASPNRKRQLTAEYLAGFIDGEGCIGIRSNQLGVYSVRVAITNTFLPTLQAIQAEFGGKIYPRRSSRTKQQYALTWSNKEEIFNLLTSISPYVISKKPEIDLVLEQWFPLVQTSCSGRKLDSFTKEKREIVAREVQRLKQYNFPLHEVN